MPVVTVVAVTTTLERKVGPGGAYDDTGSNACDSSVDIHPSLQDRRYFLKQLEKNDVPKLIFQVRLEPNYEMGIPFFVGLHPGVGEYVI